MIDYTNIYRPKQHYLTIPQIPTKKVFMNQRQVLRLLDKQEKDWDIFITKYPKDNCVSMIILDFDDKDDPNNALRDVQLLKRFLHRKGLNTVIVQSGRKGYHAYIQIPVHNFIGGELAHADCEVNYWFKEYIKNLIGLYDGKYYPTLDETNTNAGLGGNIRLIGSKHPKGTICKIIDGEFISNVETVEWDWRCFELSKSHAEDKVTELKTVKRINVDGDDLINDNDLQEIFPQIFGVELKHYNGYSYCCCPFHDDKKPSMFLDKEKYCCNSCGERGNIYTLIKKGLLKLENDVRVG
ncbi:CHC2 zinc finger domain-containing protein [Methanobrevibacter sp.]